MTAYAFDIGTLPGIALKPYCKGRNGALAMSIVASGCVRGKHRVALEGLLVPDGEGRNGRKASCSGSVMSSWFDEGCATNLLEISARGVAN